MYWMLIKPEEHPRRVLEDARRSDNRDRLKDNKDNVKVHEQLNAWNQAKGKNFFLPPEKTAHYFLSVAMIKFLSGGNSASKTATDAVDVVMQCEGWHPLQRENLEILAKDALDSYYYWHSYTKQYVTVDTSFVRAHAQWVLDNKLWIPSPPIMARCVTVDFPNGVEKFCGPEVERWATKSELENVLYRNEKKRIITWKNGSFLEFMTTDQDLDAHGGVARHVVWYDEEPKSDYWQEGMMRILTVKGRMILGMTAVKGISWPKLEIWDKWENLLEERKLRA